MVWHATLWLTFPQRVLIPFRKCFKARFTKPETSSSRQFLHAGMPNRRCDSGRKSHGVTQANGKHSADEVMTFLWQGNHMFLWQGNHNQQGSMLTHISTGVTLNMVSAAGALRRWGDVVLFFWSLGLVKTLLVPRSHAGQVGVITQNTATCHLQQHAQHFIQCAQGIRFLTCQKHRHLSNM